jgi:hypothetical protein
MQDSLANAATLAAAIHAHEKYVVGYPGGIRADLKFLKAPGLDLSWRRLDDIELSGADLPDANLACANLSRASLNCANIVRANLSGANLWHADLRGAHIQGVNFEQADMDGADFRQATIAMIDRNGKWTAPGTEKGTLFVSFANCSLRGARLNNANLKNARFDGALLNEASFWSASNCRTFASIRNGCANASPTPSRNRTPAFSAALPCWTKRRNGRGRMAAKDARRVLRARTSACLPST